MKKHFTISAVLFAALPLVPMRGTSRPAAKQDSPSTPAHSVDFEFYKTRVEPIFLEKRPGHARCYVCHSVRTPFRLEKLLPGSTSWTEEQSRRNFEVVSRLVTSGDPLKSRLLMHPLSPLVGGDPNHHQGGRQFESRDDPDWMTMAEWVRGGSAGAPGAQATAPSRAAQSRLSAGTVRIYITNSAGDTVDVIDPVADKVVQRIEGTEAPHDVNFSRDGNRVYVSIEAEGVLDVFDQQTGNIIKKISLSGRPNVLAVTKDGGRVFVAIRSEPGALDVIDTTSLERVRSIPMKGGIHDVYLTPDGKYVVAGSVEAKLLTVVDVQTEQPVWELNFDNGVRTMAFERGPDGSTRRIFVNTSLLHGFEVVDFAERKVVAKIKLPDEPSGGRTRDIDPAHGIGVAPDNKTLWANSKHADAVFVYSLPDLKLLGHVLTGEVPEWLTFTPDSKKVYISTGGENTVSVVDAKTLKMVARIPVGQFPERNNTLVLP